MIVEGIILTYGRNKYKDITRNIEGIYKMKPYEICKLLTAVIEEKAITVREDEKIILQHTIFFATQSIFHINQDQTDGKRPYWSNDSRRDPLSVWHNSNRRKGDNG
jgi:hypothetical protein